MNTTELKARTKEFALRVVRMTESRPCKKVADILGRQVLRSACSVAANDRAAWRAKSWANFASKLDTVEEEADELTAMAIASIRTARRGLANPYSAIRNPQ